MSLCQDKCVRLCSNHTLTISRSNQGLNLFCQRKISTVLQQLGTVTTASTDFLPIQRLGRQHMRPNKPTALWLKRNTLAQRRPANPLRSRLVQKSRTHVLQNTPEHASNSCHKCPQVASGGSHYGYLFILVKCSSSHPCSISEKASCLKRLVKLSACPLNWTNAPGTKTICMQVFTVQLRNQQE